MHCGDLNRKVQKGGAVCICVADSFCCTIETNMGFPDDVVGKESACQCRRCKRHGFHPSGGEDPLEKEMGTHSSILAWRVL